MKDRRWFSHQVWCSLIYLLWNVSILHWLSEGRQWFWWDFTKMHDWAFDFPLWRHLKLLHIVRTHRRLIKDTLNVRWCVGSFLMLTRIKIWHDTPSSDSGVSAEAHSTGGSGRGLIQRHRPLPAGQSDSSTLRVNHPHSLSSSGESDNLPHPVLSACQWSVSFLSVERSRHQTGLMCVHKWMNYVRKILNSFSQMNRWFAWIHGTKHEMMLVHFNLLSASLK